MGNYKLTIEYDGTGYHGWQRQKKERTLQEEIETALAVMVQAPVTVIGSGRTDAGVHALGQVANFHCDTKITETAFREGLNSLLPEDIVIRECCRVDPGFHARYDAVGKRYRYRILNRHTPSALSRRYEWHIRKPLNRPAMETAAAHLIGTHDFKSFEGTGSPRSHTVRSIVSAGFIVPENDRLEFWIEGNGFLRFMVRNIVSTLVDVGLGKTSPNQFLKILQAKDRGKAGATAPPRGLCLICVKYE